MQVKLNNRGQEIFLKEEEEVEYKTFPKHRVSMKSLLKKKGWKGKWSGKEEVKYIQFLKDNLSIMEDKESRIKSKIFIKMSKKVRSRNSDQCRSHHQKLVEYYETAENIISHYENNVFSLAECLQRKNLRKRAPSELDKDSEGKSNPFYQINALGGVFRIEIDVGKMATFSL